MFTIRGGAVVTRLECEEIRPGMRCLIGDRFIEDSYEGLEQYFETIQTVEKIDFAGSGWIYFEGLPQPFAFSEVDRIVQEIFELDDPDTYGPVDMALIFGEE